VKDDLTEHERAILRDALSLEESSPPHPWRRAAFLAGGGLIAAGWDMAENVLLVSHSGFSVATPSGLQLVRDRDTERAYKALSTDSLTFEVPGHNQTVRVFGTNGGDGSHVAADGWSVEVVQPQWPRARVILRPPAGPGAGQRSYFEGATRLGLEGLDLHDWLRTGFSPSGTNLLVVSSSGCIIFSRAPAG
jgi:hypothetical protein